MIDNPRTYWDIAQKFESDPQNYEIHGETEWVHKSQLEQHIEKFALPQESEVYVIYSSKQVEKRTLKEVVKDKNKYFTSSVDILEKNFTWLLTYKENEVLKIGKKNKKINSNDYY